MKFLVLHSGLTLHCKAIEKIKDVDNDKVEIIVSAYNSALEVDIFRLIVNKKIFELSMK